MANNNSQILLYKVEGFAYDMAELCVCLMIQMHRQVSFLFHFFWFLLISQHQIFQLFCYLRHLLCDK